MRRPEINVEIAEKVKICASPPKMWRPTSSRQCEVRKLSGNAMRDQNIPRLLKIFSSAIPKRASAVKMHADIIRKPYTRKLTTSARDRLGTTLILMKANMAFRSIRYEAGARPRHGVWQPAVKIAQREIGERRSRRIRNAHILYRQVSLHRRLPFNEPEGNRPCGAVTP